MPSKIPLYAICKLSTSVISPLFLSRGGSSSPAEDGMEKPVTTSRKQEKLRRRQEKGDPRVKLQTVRK